MRAEWDDIVWKYLKMISGKELTRTISDESMSAELELM